MESIYFLCSKGVVEISKNYGFDTYKVFLERRYIGTIMNNSAFGWWLNHQVAERPTFTPTEAQIIVDIALKKTIPASLITSRQITIDGEPWSIMRVLSDRYEMTNAGGFRCGLVWLDKVQGRLMWVSDTISQDHLRQLSVQMQKVSGK